MRLLYLYTVFYLIFIIFIKDKSRKVVFVSTLTIYMFSSVAAIHVYDAMYKGFPIMLNAVTYHIIMLFLLLYPLRKFDKYRYVRFPKDDDKKIKILSIIIIVSSLLKILFDIQNVNLNVLLSDVQSLRQSLTEGSFRDSNTLIRYLKYFAGQYWSVALVLAFYYMRYYPQKKIYILLLLASSLSVIVSGFVVAAREYLIKYLYVFLILTYWLAPSISHQWGRILKKFIVLLGTIFIVFFLVITFLRFGESSSYNSPMDSMLSYFGQGYIHFSTFFAEFEDGLTQGAIRFPLFAGKHMSSFNLNEIFYTDASLNAFPTTIGSWYFEVGYVWTIIITIIHYLLFTHIGNSPPTIFKLIYVIWIYEFIFSSIFFYNEVLNGSRVVSILFIIIFEKIPYNPYSVKVKKCNK